MMSLVDEIERSQSMIHCHVDQLRFLHDSSGYLANLTTVALEGGFITTDTLEAMQMAMDVAFLRKTATEIEGLRAKLIANAPVNVLAAG